MILFNVDDSQDPNAAAYTIENIPTATELHDAYESEIPGPELFHTGGYWLGGSQLLSSPYPNDQLIDVTFDPLEELVWGITRMGQLTAFYSVSLERYISTTIPLLPCTDLPESVAELKQVYPSPRTSDHAVYVLASNALYAYSKFGQPCAVATDKNFMTQLECMTATGPTGAALTAGPATGAWPGVAASVFSRMFVGGLQPALLELDAVERWGEVIRTVDVGEMGGSVVLSPFSSGFCAGTSTGKVLVVDPRTSKGIVRELDAHTAEISDIAVVPHGNTLVTCGWSKLSDAGLRVDRLMKVYDLRTGRGQLPLTASLDPCFCRFFPGCADRLFVAAQTGAFQTIQFGDRVFSPNDLGQLWLNYDRLVAMDISQNGNCALFGTESGQIHLFMCDINITQFNMNPLPTEFASPLAESLWPTNCLSGSLPPTYPLMLLDDPANSLYGTNLLTVGKAAAEAAELQLLATSLHQPAIAAAAAASDERGITSELIDLVESRKAEAATEAVMVAYKPVDYDDYRFSSSSVPFLFNPPPVLDDKENESTGKNSMRSSSDWPEDLYAVRPRPMLPVDPDLIAGANRKRTVRKPAHWGSVWHPYPLLCESLHDATKQMTKSSERLGRFVSASDKKTTQHQ